jgi:hypothetical protein
VSIGFQNIAEQDFIVCTGFIMWDVDTSFYTEDCKMLGETVAHIISSPQRFRSSNEAVDIIQSITGMISYTENIWSGTGLSHNMRTFLGVPTQWSNRSMAALLLCIHCVDDKPVISYFKHLSSNDQIGMAMDILSNVFHLASEFIPSRNLVISWYHIVRACLTVLITFRTISDSVIDPCST